MLVQQALWRFDRSAGVDDGHSAAARGRSYVINYDGVGITKLRRSWATVRSAADLGPDVTPHTLRHTAITWQLQAGVEPWEVAGWAGLTLEMIDEVYGHHSAGHQQNIGRRRK